MTTNTFIYPMLSFCNSSSNLNSIKVQPNSISKKNISTKTHHQQAPSKQKEKKIVSSSLGVNSRLKTCKHENTSPTNTIKTNQFQSCYPRLKLINLENGTQSVN